LRIRGFATVQDRFDASLFSLLAKIGGYTYVKNPHNYDIVTRVGFARYTYDKLFDIY